MLHTVDGYLGARKLPGLLTADVDFDGRRHIRCSTLRVWFSCAMWRSWCQLTRRPMHKGLCCYVSAQRFGVSAAHASP